MQSPLPARAPIAADGAGAGVHARARVAGGVLAVLALLRGVPLAGQAPAGAPLNAVVGDLAVRLVRQPDGAVAVGLADSLASVSFVVRPTDLRRWTDTLARLVARPPATARRGRPARDLPVAVDEPGLGAGTLVVTRRDSAGRAWFRLFAADAALVPVRGVLSAREVRALVALVRRALPPAPPRRAQPRPAARDATHATFSRARPIFRSATPSSPTAVA